MKKSNIFFLSRTALTIIFLGRAIDTVSAQNISVVGENATIANGCALPYTPSNCATQVMTAVPPFDPISPWNLPTAYNTGIVFGTNMTNGSQGPAVSGSASVSAGAIVNSAYVYAGYELNTNGAVTITGSGSKWTSYSAGVIGFNGQGSFNILDGGHYFQPNPDHFFLGYASSGVGEVRVRGVDLNGNRSTLDVSNRIVVGNFGQGRLWVEDGGLVSGGYTTFVGEGAGSIGSIVVDGVNARTGLRSTLTTTYNHLQVGVIGVGDVTATDGGLIHSTGIAQIGGNQGGRGSITVDGVNATTGDRSSLDVLQLRVADNGLGVLNITNGALAQVATQTYLGRFEEGDGTINVVGVNTTSGDRSSLMTNELRVGYLGGGHLNVSRGAEVSSVTSLDVGSQQTGVGEIQVNGAGSYVHTPGIAKIGVTGQGALTLTEGGAFEAGSIEMATDSTGSGVINIGQGGLAGMLNTSSVTGGLGTAVINLNHSDDIQFSPLLTGNMDVNKIGAGRTTLMSENDYSGTTNLVSGTLIAGGRNRLGANSMHKIGTGATLMLQGYNQNVFGIEQAGVIEFGGLGGTVLEIAGNYVGNDGMLKMNTVFGDDSSVTDRLVVGADMSGTSKVIVENRGGAGAATKEGIELITVQGVSNGKFDLVGHYTLGNGRDAIVVGAYAYQLLQGNQSGTETEHWYLRSDLYTPPTPVDPTPVDPTPVDPTPVPPTSPVKPVRPLYQAGAPLYETYPQLLLAMNDLPTLQQRVINRYWSKSDNDTAGQSAQVDEQTVRGWTQPGGNGVWGRVEGSHSKIKPRSSTSSTDYNYDIFKMQLGFDGLLRESAQGALIGGVNTHYVQGKAHVYSDHGDGTIKATGYGVGGSLTWYGRNNVYVDNQVQLTWFDSNLDSRTAKQSLVHGNKGFGYALSTELGKRIALNANWSITPQVQLLYSNARFDGFIDTFEARVTKSKADSLQARIGVGANYQREWVGEDGKPSRSNVYAIVNLYNEFLDGTKVDVSGVQFMNKSERLGTGLGLGGNYNWGADKYAIYGEATVKTSVKHFGDSYGYKGTIGLRIRW